MKHGFAAIRRGLLGRGFWPGFLGLFWALGGAGVQAQAPADCEFVRMEDVLQGALKLDVKFCKPYEQLRLGKILHQLGYRRGQRRVGNDVKKVWYPVNAKNCEPLF